SHSFTLLRLAPALIWESGERPAPFAGTVEIDATPAENDASMSAPAPTVSVNPAQGGQEPPIWEGDSTTIVSPPAAQPVPDVMEDMLPMVGLDGTADMGKSEEPVEKVP
ncbi:relaxase, partial [Pseudomonas aeruginosa]|nr:relaxase [Pseudomonas aeruginosa]